MIDWLERNRGFILVTLINLALIGGLAFWLRRPTPTAIEILPPAATPSPIVVPTATPSPLRVYVTGAVMHPDVYQLPPGSIVKDAIQSAGGASPDADLKRINLAQELQDQQQVYVPRVDESDAPPPVLSAGPTSTADRSISVGKININAATAAELETLPGIGPKLAESIVEYRTAHGLFKSIEEITLVSGIGEATFADIRDHITVGD